MNMSERQRLIPKKDSVLWDTNTSAPRSPSAQDPTHPPVVELEAWSPVGRPQQSLDGAGQVDKQVAHEEEPGWTQRTDSWRMPQEVRVPLLTYMERMGATASSEAMRIPISQMATVSSSAQVGSPFAFP